MHWRRYLPLAVLAALVLSVAPAGEPTAATAGQQDETWVSNSYYVGSTDGARMGRLGCFNRDKQGRMTLFFGAPADVDGRFGASMWAARNQTTGTIAELVRQFVRGYVWCRQNPSHQLFIGIGTSNSVIDGKPDGWLTGHGRAWAEMVRSVSDWADHHYPGVVRIYGAWDAEPSWSSPAKARRWMDGYDGLAGGRPLYANFSADGCSWTSSDNAACNNGWSQHDMWELSWQRPPSMPIPQQYASSGVNAEQWQKISEYGARHHDRPLTFYGTMTQRGACQQVGGCRGTSNTPRSARDQLLWHLNTNPLTAQAEIESMTDMWWHS